MSLKRNTIILLIAFLALGSICNAQRQFPDQRVISTINSNQVTRQPGLEFPDYPVLELPPSCKSRQLPSSVDNSVYPYLRPVFLQQGASCGQSAAVGYNFCYEVDRLRNLPANVPGNQYPSHFTWNFMNASYYYGVGVSYLHSFEILRSLGCPNESTFGPITMDDPYFWMSGYDKYYEAMHNRISAVNSIPVGTPDGLLTLKHWLNDHLDGSTTGGVANFYTGLTGYAILPANTPKAGKCVVTNWYQFAVHALTIVGYDDSIRYDLNNDGQFTNTMDINSDGVVDMRDWEIGGVKFVNSYGTEWADSGFCYALYSSLAQKYGEGGIWNNTVHVIAADSDYSPLLTLKATIRHPSRGHIRIRAGVSSDTLSTYPETILEFPVFNFQGGDNYMTGGHDEQDKEIEIGLDITPLIGATNPGAPARYFLLIQENDPDQQYEGSVEAFTVMGYGNQPVEYNFNDTPFSLVDNGLTVLSVKASEPCNPLLITPDILPAVVIGQPFNQQLEVSSGDPPFSWQLKRNYYECKSTDQFIPENGLKLNPSNDTSGIAVCALPFPFRFYGKSYDSIFIHTDGYLLFEAMNAPYPYLQDENLYLKQIRAIACFMSSSQNIINPDDGIWFQADTNKAVITWKTGIPGSTVNGYSNFSITLFPDGRIGYSYGDISLPQGIAPVVGISDGDGVNFLYTGTEDQSSVNTPQDILLQPDHLPGGLELSDSGLLFSNTVSQDFSGDICITVTDKKHIRTEKIYTLTTGPLIKASISAGKTGNDAQGEEYSLTITLHNNTPADINDLQLDLVSLTGTVLVTDSTAAVEQLLQGKDITLANAFKFSNTELISGDKVMNFGLKLLWDSHEIDRILSFHIYGSRMMVSGPLVNDHENQRLDPGESCGLQFRLICSDNMTGTAYSGKLTSTDPYISVNEPSLLPFDSTGSNSFLQSEWPLQVNSAAPHGHIAAFTLTLISNKGQTLTEDFKLVIGQPSILVIDLDKNTNSAIYIASSIRNLNLNASRHPAIDSTVFNYKNLFLCLGTRTYNHSLTAEEGTYLEQFIAQGGNVYLEGGSAFGGDIQLPLHQKFRVLGQKQAWLSPADTLVGDSASITEGIQFDYRGEHLMAFNIDPLPPATSLFTDKHSGYHFTVANDSISYRTIASTIEFGGIYPFNGPGRDEIMLRYLNFFGVNTVPLAANFTSNSNETCIDSPLHFESLCAGYPITYHWTFEGGTPAESDNPAADVRWKIPGSYTVSLSVSDSVSSNNLVKENQVMVKNCTGVPGDEESALIRIFPNPATDNIRIVSDLDSQQQMHFQLTDIAGRTVRYAEILIPSGNTQTTCNLSGISPGLYLMTLSNNTIRKVLKIVIR